MAVDPVWSLRPCAVEFDMLGQTFTVPAKSAAEWLEVLVVEQTDLGSIVPGWCGLECRRALTMGLLRGSFTRREWEDLVLEVIGVVSGRRWWQAITLIASVRANWTQVYGALLLRGLEPHTMSLAAWLDGAYALATEHMESKDRIQFDLALDTPPSTVSDEEAIDSWESEQAFLALMNAVG